MRPRHLAYVLLAGALIGLWFSSVSTYDFVAHLDRQVHGIHCSFLPGIAAPVADGGGCQVTMMSPYSSLFRQSLWGGIPLSLMAMATFAFLVFWAVGLLVFKRLEDPKAALFTLAATLLPFGMTLIMGYLSLTKLNTVCKQCMGIYTASTIAFGAGFALYWRSRTTAPSDNDLSWNALAGVFAVGVLFVAVPVIAYVGASPNFTRYVGTCGELDTADGADEVLVTLGAPTGSSTMIEVLDPLCPSCRGFEERFEKIDAADQVTRKALLFPLDSTCNWMITESIHPGACTLSEAVLCAGNQADEVLQWAFSQQEEIVSAAQADPKAAARMVKERFPALSSCVGTPKARAKVNLALRFAVKNRLRILTPQVYVDGLRLCDEDTDLGLEYALPRLIERARSSQGGAT